MGVILTGLAGTVLAQSISITSPTTGQTISGTSFQFTSTLTSLPGVYSVEYDVNGTDGIHVACMARSAPWSCNWNTYYVFGGPYNTVLATARGVLNNTLATSAGVTFTVANPLPVPASVFSGTITPPGSWTGTVAVSHTATGTDASFNQSALFVDGQPSSGGVLGCCNVITTNYDNGSHLVRFIAMDGNESLGGSNQWSAAFEWEQQVTFSNGATSMELRMSPGYEVFLCTTAQTNCPSSIVLTGKVYNTDESSSAATFPSAPTFTGTGIPTYPTVPVTLSACSSCSSETVTAQAVGTVQLLFTESGGKTRRVWVHVNTSNVLPHFGTDGSILTAYNPAKSIFTTSVFESAGSPFGDPFYPAAFNYSVDMANSGINTAEFGCTFAEPTYSGTSQSSWTTSQSNYVTSLVSNYLSSYGLYWNCTGDNLMRGTPEVFKTTQGQGATSYSPALVTSVMESLESSRLISVHMIDEANSIWGDKPLQTSFTWGAPIGSFSCVSGGNCTMTCASSAQSGLALSSGCAIQSGSNKFIVTGTGDSNMDYNTTSGNPPAYVVNGGTTASNGGSATFTFATPSGVGTKSYTSSANPGLTVQWAVDSAFDASGNECPSGGSSPGPCVNWVHNNAFQQFMTWANAATGTRPKITWDVQGGYDPASIQNWMGDPNIADFSQTYYLGNAGTYTAGAGSLMSTIKLDDAYNYRNRYAALGSAGRLTPVLTEGKGTPIDYGFQGYPVAITSISGNLITFAAPHGITNILPWDTRLWISGNSSSTYNTNFYLIDCPSPTTCHVAFSAPKFTASFSGSVVTATAQNGSTFLVNNISAQSGSVFTNQVYGPGSPSPCNIANFRGQTFTVTGTGTAFDTATLYLIPAPLGFNGCPGNNSTWFGQVPGSSSSGTGGTATIVLSDAYVRGVNWIGPGSSEDGPRYAFGGAILQAVMGAAGVRIYQAGINYDNPTTHSPTATFQSTSNINVQAGLHPRYAQYGTSQMNWFANSMAAMLENRLTPCLFEPRGSGPDYGQFFEATVRISSICNLLMVESLADNALTRTVDLTPIVVSGQATVKYCAGWRGITVSTIPAGTTSDLNNIFDPDSCEVAAYVGAPNAANWYTPPVISARLADVPNAASIAIQWTYSPIQFAGRQVNGAALYQTYSLGAGTVAPPIDRQIGTVYYRLLYLGSNSAVLATSDVQTF